MENNLQYAEKSYWDERFKTEDNFEWLCDFEAFKQILVPHFRKEYRILHIGCGSSQLSMRLYEMGFKKIVNVDYSQVLVDACRSRYSEEYPEMEWICDDIRTLENIEDGSVDVVLEKATLEALLVAEKSPWNPSDFALSTLDSVFSAVERVLSPSGLFLSVSFTQPHFRVPALLRRKDWGVDVQEFGLTFHYYVYCMTKGQETSPEIRERYGNLAKDWLRCLL